MTKQSKLSVFSGDIMASLVLCIIALPLSLGIAMASGISAASAIIAIVIGGLIVGTLSGAPLVVSGPAAGLSALVLQFVTQYDLKGLMIITILAGMTQVLFGVLRGAGAIKLIPKTVLEGVLSAIGFVIVIGQLHVLAGHNIPGGPIKSLIALPQTFALAISDTSSVGFHALCLGTFAIAIQMAWKQWSPKSLKVIPAALPAVIIATLASLSLELPRVVLQPLGSYATDSFQLILGNLNFDLWITLLAPAIGLALVASAESLLTATAVDLLAKKHHIPSSIEFNRELIAQGVGNTFSGLLGGLPVSGVMVRSAANVESGGTTRLATMLHATWVIGFILLFPKVIGMLPSTALASVLILTGIKLINFKHLVQAVQNNPRQAYLWPMTAIAILGTDLLKGLIAGIVVALADYYFQKMFGKNTQSQTDQTAVNSSILVSNDGK